MSKLRKWWKSGLAIVLAVVALQMAMSFLVRTHRVHTYLTARLERAFGRPVEVRSFDARIFPNLQLYADGVTVGEDPAFGYEYFLRAEHLSAGLRWKGLLGGHFEFGTLSFSRPSLILVRTFAGRWNLEGWLPPAKNTSTQGLRIYGPPSPVPPVNHLQKIKFYEGRIDFKNQQEKLPFAFTGVAGSVEQVSPGRWELQLEAQPWRSGVLLQSTGTWRGPPLAYSLRKSPCAGAKLPSPMSSAFTMVRITASAVCLLCTPRRRALRLRMMARAIGPIPSRLARVEFTAGI